MPFIRVNCPKGALTAEQKAKLVPRLVQALIRQEIDPVTEIGTAATGFFFNELDTEICFPGGVPISEHPDKMFWTVEAFVAASYFSQPRRDEMQRDIAAAFVDVLGDDGSVLVSAVLDSYEGGVDVVAWRPDMTLDQSMRAVPDRRRRGRALA